MVILLSFFVIFFYSRGSSLASSAMADSYNIPMDTIKEDVAHAHNRG